MILVTPKVKKTVAKKCDFILEEKEDPHPINLDQALKPFSFSNQQDQLFFECEGGRFSIFNFLFLQLVVIVRQSLYNVESRIPLYL